MLQKLARNTPDILILHEGPAIEARDLLGSPASRAALEKNVIPLVVSGHTQWPEPLVELQNGSQVLNVDSRVVVLRA